MNSDEEAEEEAHFHRIIGVFRGYLEYSKSAYKNDPLFKQIEESINVNQKFFNHITEVVSPSFTVEADSVNLSGREHENLNSLLRQCVREWSLLGKPERDISFAPILDQLVSEFKDPYGCKILLPGAGLGRLLYEVSCHGFECQGNDDSLFMLFTAQLLINNSKPNAFTIQPFFYPSSNVINRRDQFLSVSIPDIQPSASGSMSMVAGDWMQIYKEREWSCVITCFFIDTCRDITLLIERMAKIILNGGIWINFGPLLWHHDGSLELSVEDIRKLIAENGFYFESESFHKSTYAQNPKSMMMTVFNCWMFTARLKLQADY